MTNKDAVILESIGKQGESIKIFYNEIQRVELSEEKEKELTIRRKEGESISVESWQRERVISEIYKMMDLRTER